MLGGEINEQRCHIGDPTHKIKELGGKITV